MKLYGESKPAVVLEVNMSSKTEMATAVAELRYRVEVRFWPEPTITRQAVSDPKPPLRLGIRLIASPLETQRTG